MNHDKLPFVWRPNLTRVFSDRYHPTIYRPRQPNGAGSRKHKPLVGTRCAASDSKP